jgi:CpeT protein
MLFTKKIGLLALAAGLFFSCSISKKNLKNEPETAQLIELMTGHFNSTAQAARDTDFYDITLHMAEIWKKDKENYWLYVEQAVTQNLEKPYRQRIYRVEKLNSQNYQSAVYTFSDEKKIIGWWKNPEKFDAFSPSDLTLRNGCTVFLKKNADGSFEGSTREADCESSLRGAKYATSKVKITRNGIESWDQGFDANGKQVWGATKNGYEFLRVKK